MVSCYTDAAALQPIQISQQRAFQLQVNDEVNGVITLGGNKGENEQATLWERIDALQYILDLNKAKYPLDAHGNAQPVSSHSTYRCQKNCGNGESNE